MNTRALLMTGFLGLAVALVGCATREEAGAVTGAAIGATLGAAVAGKHDRGLAIILGAMAGAAIGSTIGRYMDEQDRMRTSLVLEKNRTHQSSTWVNPDTGYRYTVTPTRTFKTAEGPCREFTVDALIGGKRQEVYGTACRQPDGSWKVVK